MAIRTVAGNRACIAGCHRPQCKSPEPGGDASPQGSQMRPGQPRPETPPPPVRWVVRHFRTRGRPQGAESVCPGPGRAGPLRVSPVSGGQRGERRLLPSWTRAQTGARGDERQGRLSPAGTHGARRGMGKATGQPLTPEAAEGESAVGAPQRPGCLPANVCGKVAWSWPDARRPPGPPYAQTPAEGRGSSPRRPPRLLEGPPWSASEPPTWVSALATRQREGP